MTNPIDIKPYLTPLTTGILYTNAAMIIGHPAERLKVAVQIKPGVPYFQAIKPVLSGGLTNIYSGFVSCFYRQNLKITYRSMLMTNIPHQIDTLQLGLFWGTTLKASIACTADTMISTPFENIKTWQMRTANHTSMYHSSKAIYQSRGLNGFFFGLTPSIVKSFPSWGYLFFGYHLTKDKREKQGLLTSILWATGASTPITLATTPFDVIKTQLQSTTQHKSMNTITACKSLIQQHGFFSLFRGFSFRLAHKSLATVTAYAVMDISAKLKST